MKRLLFLTWIIYLIVGVILVVTKFLPSCNPGRGTGLECDFSVGKLAKIDSPAKIIISSFDPFTFGYRSASVDGWEKVTPLNIYGFYYLTINTKGPVEMQMFQSGGDTNVPYIRVSQITEGQYPSLSVSRTWYHPLTQLVQWYLFPVLLIDIALFIAFAWIFFHRFSKLGSSEE